MNIFGVLKSSTLFLTCYYFFFFGKENQNFIHHLEIILFAAKKNSDPIVKSNLK